MGKVVPEESSFMAALVLCTQQAWYTANQLHAQISHSLPAQFQVLIHHFYGGVHLVGRRNFVSPAQTTYSTNTIESKFLDKCSEWSKLKFLVAPLPACTLSLVAVRPHSCSTSNIMCQYCSTTQQHSCFNKCNNMPSTA